MEKKDLSLFEVIDNWLLQKRLSDSNYEGVLNEFDKEIIVIATILRHMGYKKVQISDDSRCSFSKEEYTDAFDRAGF